MYIMVNLTAEVNIINCWSALATAPASTSARAGVKEAIHFIETFAFFLCVSNHKSNTARQPMKLKFCRYAHFNPTRRNIKKKIGLSPTVAVLIGLYC